MIERRHQNLPVANERRRNSHRSVTVVDDFTTPTSDDSLGIIGAAVAYDIAESVLDSSLGSDSAPAPDFNPFDGGGDTGGGGAGGSW